MSTKRLIPLLLPVLAALSALPANARTYCCNDENGRRVCGDTMPPQCANRAYRAVDDKGVVRQVEAPLTPEQKAKKEAEEQRKKDEEAQAALQRRRDLALLNTYGSEADIDRARARALADMETASKQVQDKYDLALKRKARLTQEAEFYAKKPMPESLKSQMKENETDIAAQLKAMENRKQEVEVLHAKFDDEKKRYRELKLGKDGAAPQPR